MSSKKILIVDDSSTDRLKLKEVVDGAGCTVVTAASGMEAIEKAKSESPDIIFMDIIMDEMDGYKACREINKDPQTKNIPVVFVTSKNQKADRVWAELQGGKALVTKPYSSQEILDQIAAV